MKLRKPKTVKAKVAKAPDELAMAEGKLKRFQDRRNDATNADEMEKANFWIAHFTKIIEDLEKK